VPEMKSSRAVAVTAVVLYALTAVLVVTRVRGAWSLQGFATWTAGLPSLVRILLVLGFLAGIVCVATAFRAKSQGKAKHGWAHVLLYVVLCAELVCFIFVPQDSIGRGRVEGPAAQDSGVRWYRVSLDAWAMALFGGCLSAAGAFLAEGAAAALSRRRGGEIG
jgi:hypothetical protein